LIIWFFRPKISISDGANIGGIKLILMCKIITLWGQFDNKRIKNHKQK
jgi:hypothetical protein